METRELNIIGYIKTDFGTKFGLPRQAGLAESLKGEIEFAAEYRDPNAVKGLSEFSHIWVLWEFSEARKEEWSPTVRPPKLGGNERVGVFATRSPFRPNPIGMSVVKLDSIEFTKDRGPVLHISGIDMMDGTPVYDIKPYIAYADSKADASSGFVARASSERLSVHVPKEMRETLVNKGLSEQKINGLIEALSLDPRPSYIEDCDRVYGFIYAGLDIKFKVVGNDLTVVEV